jgi:pyruvate formate lyase activating enzyme
MKIESAMDKRNFIKNSTLAVCGISCFRTFGDSLTDRLYASPLASGDLWKWSKECFFYENTPRGMKCLICPNECVIRPKETSICRNRINADDKLYSIAYGNPCAIHIDPVEKKPLFHFKPGSMAFSIATAGCNFACLNCQNWTISQFSPKETNNIDLMPDKVVSESILNECQSIAYTYSEPVTFYEYMFDTANLARKKKIGNIMVSNGYINEKPLRALCKVLDAASIDLKSFNETTYLKLNAGKLQPVLNSIKILKEENIWLELSNLIIPGWSDDLDMIKKMTDWLFVNGFQNVPLHFLRFQPQYKLTDIPPTPLPVLSKAKEIAIQSGIHYVYIGNVPGLSAVTTYCSKCKKELVVRKGISIISNIIKNEKCPYCNENIPGRWE